MIEIIIEFIEDIGDGLEGLLGFALFSPILVAVFGGVVYGLFPAWKSIVETLSIDGFDPSMLIAIIPVIIAVICTLFGMPIGGGVIVGGIIGFVTAIFVLDPLWTATSFLQDLLMYIFAPFLAAGMCAIPCCIARGIRYIIWDIFF